MRYTNKSHSCDVGRFWLRALVWVACLVGAFSSLSCGGSGGSGSSGSSSSGVSVSISPTSSTVPPSGTATFQATVTGSSNQLVAWSANLGTITATGVYTAPVIAGNYFVTATSLADSSKSASVTVAVVIPGTQAYVTVSPSTATLGYGGQTQFTATVTGSGNQTVTWNASSGTIDSTGLYTAPNQATTVTVRAHSVAVPTATSSAQVSVVNTGPIVQINPLSAKVPILGTYQFTASVLNTTNQNVTWSATGGAINSQGLFTAGSSVGTFQVTATSAATPSTTATASVLVTPVYVIVGLPAPEVVVNQSVTLTAYVSGITNKTVTWTTSAGAITSNGVFTAPSTAQTVTITATSTQNPAYTGSLALPVVTATDDFYDFSNGIPASWSPATSGVTPSGTPFLGAFNSAQTATLTLGSLTPHTSLTIKFDAYIIGAWTGITGNSPLVVTVDGNSAFSQTFSNVTGDAQSYPNGSSINAPGTGAIATNSLGYVSSPAILFNDATYYVVISSFSHTASTVTIVFSSNLSGTASQMSWGLKNVEVIANP
jgi:hypothetical protein